MFALRSSPSSLVCDLRNTLLPAAEGGFQLSAPRPRRASVRLGFDIYYAGAGGEADGGLSGGGGGSAFSPAVSDYAGVFEAGDPARARESMNNNFGGERPTGLVEEEEEEQQRAPSRDDDDLGGNGHRHAGFLAAAAGADERGAAGGPGALGDHDEGGSVEEKEGGLLDEDFMFEMEGLKEERQQQDQGMRVVANGGSRTGRRAGGGGDGWGATAIAGAAAAAAASNRGTAGGRGEVGGVAAPRKFHGTPTYASLSPSSPSAGGGSGKHVATGAAGVGGGGPTLRKPRVIAPRGTRCIGGGMYRLRLSTSC